MDALFEKAKEAARYLQGEFGGEFAPDVAVILGSGLDMLISSVENPREVSYRDVPNMLSSSAPGHKGCFVAGTLGGRQVICMRGRLHAYEGHSAKDVAFPVFVMAELGAGALVATNASGGINVSYNAGDIVSVTDHINFTGQNPLVGSFGRGLPCAFIDMCHAYSPRLLALVQKVAQDIGEHVPQGVYVGDLGPSFETPAEIRAFRAWGADIVGMSTVFEVIAASYLGMECAVLSLVTNMAAGVADRPITAQEVVDVGESRACVMARLVEGLIRAL